MEVILIFIVMFGIWILLTENIDFLSLNPKHILRYFRHRKLIGQYVIVSNYSVQASYRDMTGRILQIQNRVSFYATHYEPHAKLRLGDANTDPWIPLRELTMLHKRHDHLLPEGQPRVIKGKKGGEKKVRRMPRIFKFSLYLALVWIVWDLVFNLNQIVTFVVQHSGLLR